MVVIVEVRISVIMVLRRHMEGPVLHIITLSCVHISWLLFGGWSYILITFILNLFTNCYCIGSFYFVFSCRLVDFRVYWVCWFCPGTCFWRCNLIFDCDDEAGLLCLFRWFIWMANMFTAKCLPWSLVYFSLNEGLVRTVSWWNITEFHGFDVFVCSPLWFPFEVYIRFGGGFAYLNC